MTFQVGKQPWGVVWKQKLLTFFWGGNFFQNSHGSEIFKSPSPQSRTPWWCHQPFAGRVLTTGYPGRTRSRKFVAPHQPNGGCWLKKCPFYHKWMNWINPMNWMILSNIKTRKWSLTVREGKVLSSALVCAFQGTRLYEKRHAGESVKQRMALLVALFGASPATHFSSS